ncbi:MarR family winged helix-turn-helix transcriptional regulator [Chitinimonas naiadis]
METLPSPTLSKLQYQALSEFRYQLRRFLGFSEAQVQSAGLTSQQYLLMLHIQGYPGRDWATVGELAERMQMLPHGIVALINRCEVLGLVERTPSRRDRRKVEVHLKPYGLEQLEALAALHAVELASTQNAFQVSKIAKFNNLISRDLAARPTEHS